MAIIVRAGLPVRLNIRREKTATCSDKVSFCRFPKECGTSNERQILSRRQQEGAGEAASGQADDPLMQWKRSLRHGLKWLGSRWCCAGIISKRQPSISTTSKRQPAHWSAKCDEEAGHQCPFWVKDRRYGEQPSLSASCHYLALAGFVVHAARLHEACWSGFSLLGKQNWHGWLIVCYEAFSCFGAGRVRQRRRGR